MPRKTPLPPIEKSIAQRLKAFREQKLISQTAFAAKLGISRAQLINYEECLAPVPWMFGHRLCELFELNPRWFVTGKLPQFLKVKLKEVDQEKFGPRTPFSKVYFQHWKISVETDTLNLVTFGFDPKKKTSGTDHEILEMAVTGWLQRIPADRFREFYLELSAEAERVIRKMNPSDAGPRSLSF